MKTKLLRVVVAATAAFSVLGAVDCGNHETTQEAYEACGELLSDRIERDDPKVFADCVACREDCGTNCNEVGTSPVTFSCQ